MLYQMDDLVMKSLEVPFTSRGIIDKDRMLELLDELHKALPEQIKQAEEVLSQRTALMDEAQRRAELILSDARQQAATLVQEHEVVRLANHEAERVRRDLATEISSQHASADRYADEVLAELEAKISRSLSTIQNGRSQLNVH